MNRKATGVLNTMPQEQQEALERWLMEESLTYEQAKERLKVEFKIEAGVWALGKFYQRCARRRMLEEFVAAGRAGSARWGAMGDAEVVSEVCEALIEVAARMAFEIPARGEPMELKQLKELAAVGALGLRMQQTEAQLEIREREAAVRERAMALREKQYEDERPKDEEKNKGMSAVGVQVVALRCGLISPEEFVQKIKEIRDDGLLKMAA